MSRSRGNRFRENRGVTAHRCHGRLLAIAGRDVLFRYRNYRSGGQWATKSLPGVEFIERFLRHVLPKGLRHIRRFGLWGNRVRTERLTEMRQLLAVTPPEPVSKALPSGSESEREEADEPKPRKCRACGGEMVCTRQTPRPTVAELMQMPPSMEIEAYRGEVQLYLPLDAFL